MIDDIMEETLRGADTEEPGRSSSSCSGPTESKDSSAGALGRQADVTSAVTDPGPTS